jgi:hypothetical protein
MVINGARATRSRVKVDLYGAAGGVMTRIDDTGTLKQDDPARLRDASALPLDDESSRVVARPDGFYWVADDGHQEFGPFASAIDALVALRSGIETGLEPDDSLPDVDAEIHYTDQKRADEGVPEE